MGINWSISARVRQMNRHVCHCQLTRAVCASLLSNRVTQHLGRGVGKREVGMFVGEVCVH